ncbi:unnamed protein product [Linum trigynum]|uniref:Uncharacterized protein n=1 Tax=Linum trigynum TaxID=586398 RepID=A0AAV2FMK7_9ROSI
MKRFRSKFTVVRCASPLFTSSIYILQLQLINTPPRFCFLLYTHAIASVWIITTSTSTSLIGGKPNDGEGAGNCLLKNEMNIGQK